MLYLCLWCVHSAHRGQRMVSNPLRLELDVLNCYVGAEDWTWVPWNSSQCSFIQSFCSSLLLYTILLAVKWFPGFFFLSFFFFLLFVTQEHSGKRHRRPTPVSPQQLPCLSGTWNARQAKEPRYKERSARCQAFPNPLHARVIHFI